MSTNGHQYVETSIKETVRRLVEDHTVDGAVVIFVRDTGPGTIHHFAVHYGRDGVRQHTNVLASTMRRMLRSGMLAKLMQRERQFHEEPPIH